MNIALFGASGRVGKLIISEAHAQKDAHIAAVFAREMCDTSLLNNCVVTNDIAEFVLACKACDVIIDFSAQAATRALLQALESMQATTPCVIGTTGLDSSDIALMQSCALRSPILYATNMSLGIALLRNIVESVASTLHNADIEISEIHHRYKKDAPSGTALSLAESCAKGRKQPLQDVLITHRQERKKSEIGIVSLRGGDVVGRHCVGFYLDGEYLEFTHTATNRATFAKGALQCAAWIINKPPRIYDIAHVFS